MYSKYLLTRDKNAKKRRQPTFVEYRIEVKDGSNLLRELNLQKMLLWLGFFLQEQISWKILKITVFFFVLELLCRGIFSKLLKKELFLFVFQKVVVE